MPTFNLDPFYLIVDNADWLTRLLPLGVRLVQLRVKDRPESEVRDEILRARYLCRSAGAQLVVNDYWKLAIDAGCDFVHLGQEDLDGADLDALRRHEVRIGVSTHDDAELDRALSISPDYVALGPVWPTLLKEMKFAPQGLEKLGAWKKRIGDIPLVAIGGLTPARACLALAAGADSACVVTDVLRARDPESRAVEWVATTAPWRDSPELTRAFPPDFAGAKVFPSPNHGPRARAVSALVLHYTGMPTAEGALELLCSPIAEVSAHYFVEEDGRILQLVPESRRAWHAGASYWAGETDMNSASIGVEIVHPGHIDPHDFPPAQIEAVIALSCDICARHKIAPERVLAHSDIAPRRKMDPGEFFPWACLAAAGVGRYVEPLPPDDGPALECDAAGEAVARLQRQLAAFGYKVSETGVYDEDTASAVAAFQRHWRTARVDGRADASTIDILTRLLS
ncbi:thiamine phosphate synthase [Methylocystis iwaonis]|uniref:thiamine phosphate synthase n=1 Tax=Methylocystis iwaonis TaxID=2885079 RepID=UPI002E7C49F9|nr:thiamine phosphate synthase [Methylocystis iwaonis]